VNAKPFSGCGTDRIWTTQRDLGPDGGSFRTTVLQRLLNR
jgi:hypothetical protein